MRQRNDIGDVIFALRIVIGELRQPALQIAAVGDQDAGIDFGDLQLIGRGVFLLDNADLITGFAGLPEPCREWGLLLCYCGGQHAAGC